MDDQAERFKRSQLFQKIVDDAPNIEEDLRTFNAQYRRFVERDDAAVGVILRCHLIVEHFLDGYLTAANPAIQEWDSARLTFAQKLALADHPRSKLRMAMPGLRCLNSLRNRLAHRLDAEFDEAVVGPIREFITLWNTAAGKPVPQGIRLVEEFALHASAWLHSDACMIARHVPEQGLLGLFDWYRDDDNQHREPTSAI
jgi:hypothetical protein